ncbi:MAG TPA: diaminopimelate decarboxylase [Stellaceae bacterium]|nr:diaminopimelate decarboxylase [Stellaceae bacterium]
MSDCFAYRGCELYAEDVAVARVAAAVGTPFYLYSTAGFVAHYRAFADALAVLDPLICFAVKANSNLAVLRLFAGLGAGADVVSEGELRRALAAGIPPQRIIFSGVGKTRAEIDHALAAGIHQINVESVPELHRLSAAATASGRTARVAIRVNPDVDAHTDTKITTGRKGDKFGIAYDEAAAAYRLAARLPGVEPVGLAVHIGSQIVELGPSHAAFARLAELVVALRSDGLAVRSLDLGGGLTIPYNNEAVADPAEYAGLVANIFAPLDLRLAFEPGRFLVASSGLLVCSVVYVKEGPGGRVIVVDAAMNDLIRPALYDTAWHGIVPLTLPDAAAPLAPADVVGPICETTDTFARGRLLPPLGEGALVAFANAGAYGAVMSSTYNSRLLVPEVLVSGERFAVVRARQSYDEMLALDQVPDWLSGEGRR